jgi:DnaJ-domain-containing protein 1
MHRRGKHKEEPGSSQQQRWQQQQQRYGRPSSARRPGVFTDRTSSTRQDTRPETSSPHLTLEQQLESMSFYELLRVDPSATTEEIRRAYRQEALVWHPDKNAHRKEEAEMRFKKIAEAYSVLSDPVKRQEYDNPMTHDTIHEHFTTSEAFDLFGMFFERRDPFSSLFSSVWNDDPFGSEFFSGRFSGRGLEERRRILRHHFLDDFEGDDDDVLFAPLRDFGIFFPTSTTGRSMPSHGMGSPSTSSTSTIITFGGSTGDGHEGSSQKSTTTITRTVNGQKTVTTTTTLTDDHGNTTIFTETPQQHQLVNESPSSRSRSNRNPSGSSTSRPSSIDEFPHFGGRRPNKG